MQNTQYISTPVSEKVSLAEESWRVFSPFLCRYQWAHDDPSHSPRSVEIANAILNRGKPGACTFFRPEGYKYVLPVLHPRHFNDSINNRCKIYYVSYGSVVLLYFDIDLHFAWQTLTDGQDAKTRLDAMLRGFFGDSVLFWSPSSRGFNGYLKVDLKGMDYALANELFDRLEAALRLFLASSKNMADFEIKGKIGFMDDGKYKWAQYGKLPIHNPEWNFAKLEEFKATSPVSIYRLRNLCDKIEAQVPQDVLQRHTETMKNRGDEPLRQGDRFLVTPAIQKLLVQKYGEAWRCKFSAVWGGGDDTWLHEKYYRPGKAPLTESELRKEQDERRNSNQIACNANLVQGHQQPGSNRQGESRPGIAEVRKKPRPVDQRDSHAAQPVAHKRGPVNLDFSDLIDEPDSFKRQTKALRRFARYLKRVPTLEEAMQLLHDHHLYTGSWEANLTRRRIRVRDILAFIAETFDPSKCANGHVNVGKFDEWARKKFPNGLIGGHRKKMDEYGNISFVAQNIHVGTSFIAAFMAVVEFALLIDRNQDNSVPHDRCKDLWNTLKDKGLISVCFNERKWAVCREELVKLGIIDITDRNYCQGKAMKWAPATYFPGLGLWKTKRHPGLMGPGLLQEKREKRTEQHNTFLSMVTSEDAVFVRLSRSRPPP